MTKNMTRKGLALGSAVALIAAGFVGASPAYATFATLDASFGTKGATQNGLLDQTFNMASTSGNTANAKFFVSGANAAELTVTHRFVTSLTSADAYAATTETDQTDGNNKAATIAPAAWTAGTFAQMNWALTGVTATRTITITPFLDTIVADGLITPGEPVGTPVTLTFHRASEVTATTTLNAINVGATSVGAKVVLDKGINMASIGGGVSVYFAENGADFGNVKTAAFVAADGAFTASSDAGPTATRVYTAQARINGTAAANNSGSAAISTVSTGTVATLDDLVTSKSVSYLEVAGATNDAVRSGAGSITVSTVAETVASAAAAGAPVTFVIQETGANSVDSAATITAGGQTLSGTATTLQRITVVVNADADGEASLAVAYAGIKNSNTFRVTVSASGASAAATGTNLSTDFTGVDSSASAIVDVNQLGGLQGDNPVHATTVGGPVNVAYKVVDQFGQTPDGTLRLRVATAATGGTINSTLAVTGGNANLAVSDNSDAAGNYNAVATVEKQNANLTWTAVAGVSTTSAIRVASALPSVTRVTVTETTNSTAANPLNVLAPRALATVDARISRDSQSLPTINPANAALSGIVYGANGAPQAGASVTLTSANVMFVTNADVPGSAHYSLGTTTIKTDATGQWGDVRVLSTVAGQHTVTVTSGTGSATEDVFFGAAAGDQGTRVTLTAPANVPAGSTLQVSAVVTDRFGNPVNTNPTGGNAADVVVSYTGPGLIVGTLPTETDANGRINFNVLLGSNDSGTLNITVTYRSIGANTLAANRISGAAAVVVGTSAVAPVAVAAFTKRNGDKIQIVSQGSGKVRFELNGKRVATRQSVGTLNRTFDLVDGKNVIEIFVDGKRVLRRAATN